MFIAALYKIEKNWKNWDGLQQVNEFNSDKTKEYYSAINGKRLKMQGEAD